MTPHITTGSWKELQHDAMHIREAVFIIEQNVPAEIECDEFDAASLHAVAYDQNGIPIGTGRLLPDGHIGRMAVSKLVRGQGVGALLLTTIINAAKARGDKVVVLNAQLQAEAFYARFGFTRQGDVFVEAGIDHIEMVLTLAQ
jgi:predicted GNAT family N-acyltransferase